MADTDKKLVLVVDDTPANIAAVTGALKASYRTKIATNGERALELARGADRPDLVLLDVLMPGMDGFEVCRRLKADPATSDIPVIFLTGKTDPIYEARGFEAGAMDYIRKPFPPDVVLARVRTQLALHAAFTDTDDVSLKQRLMSSGALATVLDSLYPTEIEPDDHLLRQGEESDAAFFLDRGALLVYEDTRHGPVTLARLEAPHLIGEIGALAGIARTASVKALTKARVYRISRAHLFKLSRKFPELLMAVVRQLGQQIESTSNAVALYTNALTALETDELDDEILEDLANPPPQLAEFSSTFRRFADQILTKRRQQEEMASAGLIQQSFLPNEPGIRLAQRGVEVQAKIRAARQVGGDFYDFFLLDDDRLAVVIGDVCGKGLPASLFMGVVVTVLRTAAREEKDAAAAVARANTILCRNNAASMFATIFYGVLDPRSGALEYCNCGHVPPVLLHAAGAPSRFAATGMPVGLYADMPADAANAQLGEGDDLLIFTDGITEALDPSGEEFGERRLLATLQGSRALPPADLVKHLYDAVDDFARGEAQFDDMTCIAVRRRRN